MLGDVARWLRILGEDCSYADPSWSDDDVLERARAEARVVVTRDAHLADRARRLPMGAVRVEEGTAEQVLGAVYEAVGLRPEAQRLATRCSLCNGALVATDVDEAAARAEAGGKAPPLEAVRARHERFWSCTRCGQPYWRGTHWATIEAVRERVLARVAAAEPFYRRGSVDRPSPDGE